MDQQLTASLQYGVGTLKDQSVTLLTLYAGSLAFLATYADKVLDFPRATDIVRRALNTALVFLLMAIGCVLASMYYARSLVDQLILGLTKNASRTRMSCEGFLNVSSFLYLFTILAVIIASFQVTPRATDKKVQTKGKLLEEEDNKGNPS